MYDVGSCLGVSFHSLKQFRRRGLSWYENFTGDFLHWTRWSLIKNFRFLEFRVHKYIQERLQLPLTTQIILIGKMSFNVQYGTFSIYSKFIPTSLFLGNQTVCECVCVCVCMQVCVYPNPFS